MPHFRLNTQYTRTLLRYSRHVNLVHSFVIYILFVRNWNSHFICFRKRCIWLNLTMIYILRVEEELLSEKEMWTKHWGWRGDKEAGSVDSYLTNQKTKHAELKISGEKPKLQSGHTLRYSCKIYTWIVKVHKFTSSVCSILLMMKSSINFK